MEDDPELSRYLNRSYWENRYSHSKDDEVQEQETNKASSNAASSKAGGVSAYSSLSLFQPSAPVKENKDKIEQPPGEVDGFVDSLRGQIETFVTRMKSNSSRGRLIANDTAVQSLFMNITALHSQLLNFIQAQDNARSMSKSFPSVDANIITTIQLKLPLLFYSILRRTARQTESS